MQKLSFFLLLLLTTQTHAACVILLHGLARSESSMAEMEQKLIAKGYTVVNDGYPSRDFKIEELAERAITPALKKCGDGQPVHFVTHSLGGILVRRYLSQHTIEHLGHVVMLGPPNQGSEVVDKLGDVPGFHFMNGDAGMQLGTGQLSVPNALDAATFDVGIIAGSRSINLILSALIPGDDDGKVSIERTRLKGMNDHIEMETSHPFMMKNNKVIEQVIYYLANGRFQRKASEQRMGQR